VWQKYQQDVIDYKSEWYILCFSAKWLGSSKIIKSKLNDFELFNKDKENDSEVVKKIWAIFDEADIIVAHNGDEFDIKKANARFLFHGLNPPSPFKTIDTKKVAKRYFNFNSNKLDDLGRYLKLGRKREHEGFKLWLKCMNGERSAWNRMLKYNIQDILLLEKLYKKFLSWITNHPNYGLYQQKDFACPNCGSRHLQKRGYNYTQVSRFQRWQCNDCHAWSQSRCSEKDKTTIK
jgi:DNA polymerase elongation subunit (family B)